MEQLALYTTTGDHRIDTLLQGTIGALETCFPERIRGYYLVGSHATSSAVADSDLDIVAVFKQTFADDEPTRCRRLNDYCSLISPVRLDVAPRCETELFESGSVSLKLASQLLYGEDIRALVPLTPLDEHLPQVLFGFFFYTALLRGELEHLTYPLDYPNPHGAFYGYERWGLYLTEQLAVGLRTLVNSTTLAATFLVGMHAARHVGSKRDAIVTYKGTIADAWTELLEEVYTLCKLRWAYRLPDTPSEQAHLRQLCQRVLSFENHALAQCRSYVLDVLAKGKDNHKLSITRSLKKISYVDAEVEAALERLSQDKQAAVRQAAQEALTHLHQAQHI
jgi:hypothetical protein